MKYIIITEDQAVYKSDSITDSIRESLFEGLLDIIDITDPDKPLECMPTPAGDIEWLDVAEVDF